MIKRFSRLLPIGLVLAVTAAPLHAEKAGRIIGRVKSGNGSGLLGAVVTVFKQEAKGGTLSFTRSDASGGYSIARLAAGAYHVQVTREGYAPVTQANVHIDPGKT